MSNRYRPTCRDEGFPKMLKKYENILYMIQISNIDPVMPSTTDKFERII